MILTIGMIVKNEEKYLDDCLNAIKPILNKVKSELIITDTGSTDGTIEIAQKYTNKILYFEWNNDFSEARNTVFNIATGEWFMYLDADEIFTSCNEIIEFFNTGEYQKYNSASYIIRNKTMDGEYSDQIARRLTKRTKNTKFSGIIHEVLNTPHEPLKVLNDIANHYGYDYTDENKRQAKYERNYNLLIKKNNSLREPDPMICSQLYDTLLIGGKKNEADKYLEKGFRICRKHEDPLIILFYCKKARSWLYEGDNDKALKLCNEYFSLNKKIRPSPLCSDIEMLAIKATVFYRQKDFNNTIKTLEHFFKTFDDVKKGIINTEDKKYVSITLASDLGYITYVGQFLDCCLSAGEYEKALHYMSSLPIYNYSEELSTLTNVIKLEIELLKIIGVEYKAALINQHSEYGKALFNKMFDDALVQQNIDDEFLLLANKLKKNIKKMLQNNDLENAVKYLNEYQKLVPSDPEIKIIMNTMNAYKKGSYETDNWNDS